MKTKSKRSFAKVVAFLLAVPMVLSIAFSAPSVGIKRALAANGGKAIPISNTFAEATQKAKDLSVELTGEGTVLLKNRNNALPIAKGVGITVFGSAASSMTGATGSATLMASLATNGFTKVKTAAVTTANAATTQAADIEGYTDVGIVMLNRAGGEGNDAAVAIAEKAADTENIGGWKHSNLAKDVAGESFKHIQMLNNDEIAMINNVKTLCDKVVVLLNTSNAMEMYNLQNDDGIDAIMHFGRPGANGIHALPKLLSGELNPSGKLADEWIKDFTVDPTWFNSMANAQNAAKTNNYRLPDGSQASSISLHGVDYSEDIYLGYKYFETVYAEIAAGRLDVDANGKLVAGAGTQAKADAWFADTVVYPFGYGLSYTNFAMKVVDISETELTAKEVRSSAAREAKVKSITMVVNVKNTGSVAGKQTVEIYSQPPYTVGGIEKASVTLVAFGKTDIIQPGKSENVTLTINLQDLASYDYADVNANGFKGYELESGTYTLFASGTSHCTSATAKATLEITGDATLELDDFSGNVIENLFSSENGRYYGLRKNDADWNADGVIDATDKMFTEEQVLLSRSDLVGTFPKGLATTTAQDGTKSGGYIVTKEFASLMDYYAGYTLNAWAPTHAYFSASKAYAIGDTFGVTASKDVYVVGKAAAAARTILVNDNITHPVGSYIMNGSNIYKVTTEIPAIEFIQNNPALAAVADRNYTTGQYVYSTSIGSSGVTYTYMKLSKDVSAGSTFATSNYTAVNVNSRVVTAGESANVETVTQANYISNVLEATVSETIVNGGGYVYSDKLFSGNTGYNGFNGNEDDLYDVTADMMKGWSQIASTADQTAAKNAAGDNWILFRDLNGITYNDTTVIESGKFATMTGAEVWQKFMNQWTYLDFYTACWNGSNNGSPVANLGITNGGVADGPNNFNSTFLWPCNTAIAQTWNVDLAYRNGSVAADLGLLKDVVDNNKKTQWLNPAINTHRTPFSGRNNEYYSQDGFHAGWFAQAVVRGIQDRGVGCHVKHMLLNDQEINRNTGDLFAWISEQNLREIYGKCFQIAIQEGGAEGAMSAFARIGSVVSPVNDNVSNGLVRKEWGATNFFWHPDMYSPQSNVSSEDLMLRTGHNHAPGGNWSTSVGNAANNTASGRWDAAYVNPLTGTLGGVMIGKNDTATGQEVYYSNNQWYIIRQSAMLMYSEYANQGHARNGIEVSRWTGGTLTAIAGDTVKLDVSFDDATAKATVVNYKVTTGTLPEGLTLNAATGKIVGSTTEAGEFNITVTGTFDKWIIGTATFKIIVRDLDLSVEFQTSETHIQWKYTGETTWTNLIALADLKGAAGETGATGAAGADGKEVVFQKSATHIQWKYEGETTWNDLVALADIKGDTGAAGATGPKGDTGEKGADGKDAAGGCGSSVSGTGALAGMLICSFMAIGAFVIIKRRKFDK